MIRCIQASLGGTHLEECLKAFLGRLFFQSPLVFRADPSLLRSAEFVEYSFKLQCCRLSLAFPGRHSETTNRPERTVDTLDGCTIPSVTSWIRRATTIAHVSLMTWYFPCTLCNQPPIPHGVEYVA